MDQRPDLTGRLLRLMNSVYFSNTKVGAGELLFALCGQDGTFSPWFEVDVTLTATSS